LDWDDVDQVDLIGLEIGYGLIPLVNPETGGQLLPRVKGVRKKLSAELGFLVQSVRIRDALNLDPDDVEVPIVIYDSSLKSEMRSNFIKLNGCIFYCVNSNRLY
jgi:flagellar biosynthesis component FlhA